MKPRPIRDLLADHPTFEGFDADDLDLIAGCARNQVVHPGEVLAREGEEADRFFVVRRGLLALEVHSQSQALTIDTAGTGEVVGWAWIFPPFRWTNDVTATELTRLVTIESPCLRDKADADPEFGYRIMKRFAQVLVDQLDATRLRLLDLYARG